MQTFSYFLTCFVFVRTASGGSDDKRHPIIPPGKVYTMINKKHDRGLLLANLSAPADPCFPPRVAFRLNDCKMQ